MQTTPLDGNHYLHKNSAIDFPLSKTTSIDDKMTKLWKSNAPNTTNLDTQNEYNVASLKAKAKQQFLIKKKHVLTNKKIKIIKNNSFFTCLKQPFFGFRSKKYQQWFFLKKKTFQIHDALLEKPRFKMITNTSMNSIKNTIHDNPIIFKNIKCKKNKTLLALTFSSTNNSKSGGLKGGGLKGGGLKGGGLKGGGLKGGGLKGGGLKGGGLKGGGLKNSKKNSFIVRHAKTFYNYWKNKPSFYKTKQRYKIVNFYRLPFWLKKSKVLNTELLRAWPKRAWPKRAWPKRAWPLDWNHYLKILLNMHTIQYIQCLNFHNKHKKTKSLQKKALKTTTLGSCFQENSSIMFIKNHDYNNNVRQAWFLNDKVLPLQATHLHKMKNYAMVDKKIIKSKPLTEKNNQYNEKKKSNNYSPSFENMLKKKAHVFGSYHFVDISVQYQKNEKESLYENNETLIMQNDALLKFLEICDGFSAVIRKKSLFANVVKKLNFLSTIRQYYHDENKENVNKQLFKHVKPRSFRPRFFRPRFRRFLWLLRISNLRRILGHAFLGHASQRLLSYAALVAHFKKPRRFDVLLLQTTPLYYKNKQFMNRINTKFFYLKGFVFLSKTKKGTCWIDSHYFYNNYKLHTFYSPFSQFIKPFTMIKNDFQVFSNINNNSDKSLFFSKIHDVNNKTQVMNSSTKNKVFKEKSIFHLLCFWSTIHVDILGSSYSNDSGSFLLPKYFQDISQNIRFKKQHITIIASTNNLTTLDPALLRPGRFDIIIDFSKYVLKPSLKEHNFESSFMNQAFSGVSKSTMNDHFCLEETSIEFFNSLENHVFTCFEKPKHDSKVGKDFFYTIIFIQYNHSLSMIKSFQKSYRNVYVRFLFKLKSHILDKFKAINKNTVLLVNFIVSLRFIVFLYNLPFIISKSLIVFYKHMFQFWITKQHFNVIMNKFLKSVHSKRFMRQKLHFPLVCNKTQDSLNNVYTFNHSLKYKIINTIASYFSHVSEISSQKNNHTQTQTLTWHNSDDNQFFLNSILQYTDNKNNSLNSFFENSVYLFLNNFINTNQTTIDYPQIPHFMFDSFQRLENNYTIINNTIIQINPRQTLNKDDHQKQTIMKNSIVQSLIMDYEKKEFFYHLMILQLLPNIKQLSMVCEKKYFLLNIVYNNDKSIINKAYCHAIKNSLHPSKNKKSLLLKSSRRLLFCNNTMTHETLLEKNMHNYATRRKRGLKERNLKERDLKERDLKGLKNNKSLVSLFKLPLYKSEASEQYNETQKNKRIHTHYLLTKYHDIYTFEKNNLSKDFTFFTLFVFKPWTKLKKTSKFNYYNYPHYLNKNIIHDMIISENIPWNKNMNLSFKKLIDNYLLQNNDRIKTLGKIKSKNSWNYAHNYENIKPFTIDDSKMCRLDSSVFTLIFYSIYFGSNSMVSMFKKNTIVKNQALFIKIIHKFYDGFRKNTFGPLQSKKKPCLAFKTIQFLTPYKSLSFSHLLLFKDKTYTWKNYELLVYNKFKNYYE